MENSKKIIIIGAGASGLAAAVAIKSLCRGLCVTVIERHNKIGRKLSASGNGRCNLSNANINEGCYNNPSFLKPHLQEFGFEAVKSFYEKLGLIVSKPDSEGRVYPATFSAMSVLDCYLRAIKSLDINLMLNSTVVSVTQSSSNYDVALLDGTVLKSDFVVFAYGSVAHTTGCDNNFLPKHKKTPLLCSLCPVIGQKSELKHLENIRVKVNATLEYTQNGIKKTYSERGEVLFKANQISGIVMFNISSVLAANKIENAKLYLDLFPDYSHSFLVERLKNNEESSESLIELLSGICVKGIANNLTERLIKHFYSKSNWNHDFFSQLASLIKNVEFNIKRNDNHKEAQVISGGISVDTIKKSFESRYYPRVFIIGEALDIDGVCGGFNLHFAVSSALSAAKEIQKLCF